MPGGNVGPGVILDLSGLDALDPPSWEERTIRVGSGVVARRVEAAAAGAGLFLPPMPSSSDRCTVGGMVANNAAGARSFRHGAVRDWVEELDVVLADGTRTRLTGAASPPWVRSLTSELQGRVEAARPWPIVRKNASGYALDRFLPRGDALHLLVGSEGTLGVVTEVRLRLAPLPAARSVWAVPVFDFRELSRVVAAATSAGATACEFLGSRLLEIIAAADARLDALGVSRMRIKQGTALVLLELDDALRPLAEVEEEVGKELGELARRRTRALDPGDRERIWSLRHAASPFIAASAREGKVSMQFIEDSVVPPRHLAAYLAGVEEILADEDTDAVFFGHAGDGNVHVNPLVDVTRPDWRERVGRILNRTAALVAELGGTLSGEHGDGRIRAPLLETIWGREWTRAFAMVKHVLDPQGIFNPGVILPHAGHPTLEEVLGAFSPEGGRR